MADRHRSGQARSILITGCSSGIGLDAAEALSSRGWKVFATCRKESDCERLSQAGLNSFILDYRDEESIASAVDTTLDQTDGTLDAVFNNGAYMLPGAMEDVPTQGLREIFETNLFGYHELTRLVLPVMRKQGHGRIVNCSSVLGLAAIFWRGPYTATKFALEGITDTLRIELRGTNIHMILIEPGPIRTRIRQNSIPPFEKWIDWESSSHVERYKKSLIPRLYDESGKPDKFELPSSAVTKKLIHALKARNPRPRYYVTTPTYIIGYMKRVLSTRMFDRLVSRI